MTVEIAALIQETWLVGLAALLIVAAVSRGGPRGGSA